MRSIIIAYILSLYISLPGLFSKAGINPIKGLIPLYNVFLLAKILKISYFLVVIYLLLLIFLPYREYFLTLAFCFLPFLLSDAYGKNTWFGIFGLFIPFFMFPMLSYFTGYYIYKGGFSYNTQEITQ